MVRALRYDISFASTLTGLSVGLKISNFLKKAFLIKGYFSWTRGLFRSLLVIVEGLWDNCIHALVGVETEGRGEYYGERHGGFLGTDGIIRNCNFNLFSSSAHF